MKENLYNMGSTCELINDEDLCQRINSFIKWEPNILIVKNGYNSAMVAALYSNMLRHAKNSEWNLAANSAEGLINFVTGDNGVLLQIEVCLLKARRKHIFINCFCKQCHEKRTENRCIFYQMFPSKTRLHGNKDELKKEANTYKYSISNGSIGENIESRRIEETDFPFDKDAIRRAVEGKNAIKNSASKKYIKISMCVDCKKLNKNCPQPETVRSSWDRMGYFCPHFEGKVSE